MHITKKLAAAALASAFALTGCSSSGDEAKPAGGEGGDAGATEFAHPSFDGLTVTLDGKPDTIVMDYYAAGGLADYGLDPAGVFGYVAEGPLDKGHARLDRVPVLGQDADIDMEKVAELKPDVIVGHGGPDGWSWFKEDVNKQLTQVAPFMPLPQTDDVDSALEQTKQIAEFLGGDVDSDEVKKAEEDWAAAKDELKKALEDSDLKILFTSPTKDVVYTAKDFPMADLFEEAGATVIGPEKPKEGNPWGKVSWEELSQQDADIIFYEGYDTDALEGVELWKSHPAVKAGQAYPWSSKMADSYSVQAEWLRDAAEKISQAKKAA